MLLKWSTVSTSQLQSFIDPSNCEEYKYHTVEVAIVGIQKFDLKLAEYYTYTRSNIISEASVIN